jgi:hypothetical protein
MFGQRSFGVPSANSAIKAKIGCPSDELKRQLADLISGSARKDFSAVGSTGKERVLGTDTATSGKIQVVSYEEG